MDAGEKAALSVLTALAALSGLGEQAGGAVVPAAVLDRLLVLVHGVLVSPFADLRLVSAFCRLFVVAVRLW